MSPNEAGMSFRMNNAEEFSSPVNEPSSRTCAEISSVIRGLVMVAVFGITLCGSIGQAQVRGASVKPAILRDVGIDQRLNQQVPLDLPFRDEQGNTVRLGDYFGRKPVILSLVYYECPMLCTTALNGLEQSLKELKFNLGQDFDVVTVSFDPAEKPVLAAAKKAVYVGLYGRPGAAEGWHFLTGDQDSIQRLTQAVGFRYNYDPNIKQFIHATGIIVLTPQGKLARYFYGISYPAGNLRLGLVEASEGKIGNPVDEVLLYCCEYDPMTGKYSLIIARVLQVGAAVTILSLGTLMFVMFRSAPGIRA
ncbi:MAG TPA: SCO family protein [Terriglobia bacterium]